MSKRLFPIVTESDKELPYYLVDAGLNWNQEHVLRPNGYLYQWIQGVKGEGELLTEGKTFRVKEGNAMLLFKGAPHEYYAISSSWIVNWLVFDGHQVEAFLRNVAGIKASGAFYVSRPDIFLSKILNVMDIGKSDCTLKSIQYSSVIYSLLTDIMQYASVNPNHSAASQNIRLKPLFDYIEQNFDKVLTLEAMAEVVEITPQYLCTLFKKTTNIRIFQYINSVRIKKSKEFLLQSPQAPIKEIACLAGFEDVNYYCSVFKNLEQISPGQFRKIQKAVDQ
ncbi:AraC-like DNA-binding protein [Anaerotaenia torta]|uniref:AraC family transcriptional regulator n=1 Tax=Anaerotaenia torta TaxID=433293 RepID=UPI003D258284